MGAFWMVFLTAFLLTLAFSPVAIRIAPLIGAVDIPKDERRMHTKPMPRFGGMAICIGTLLAVALAAWVALPLLERYFSVAYPYATWMKQPVGQIPGIIIGGFFIYLLGVVDDLKGMPAKVKLLGQIGVACIAFGFGVRIQFITNHFGTEFGDTHSYFAGALSFLVTVIWIVAIVNMINLIDGLDGLAAGVSAIASLCIAYTAYIHGSYLAALAMIALAGGSLGFIPFNFHPARIFMGDSGSMFLGYMIATISIMGPTKSATLMATFVPILVLGLPIFDTGFAILRRFVNHRPIMEADKGHLHHRLMASGMGQRRTVLTLYGISGIMGVAAVLFSRDLFVETAGLVAITAMYIYIFLTDAQSWSLGLKGINIAHEEKQGTKMQKKQFFDRKGDRRKEDRREEDREEEDRRKEIRRKEDRQKEDKREEDRQKEEQREEDRQKEDKREEVGNESAE